MITVPPPAAAGSTRTVRTGWASPAVASAKAINPLARARGKEGTAAIGYLLSLRPLARAVSDLVW